MALKAEESRPFNFLVHAEYDAGSGSDNPEEVSLFVKADEWIHVNKGWVNAKPKDGQSDLVNQGLKGGAIAFFNQKENFGVEQRFDSGDFEHISLFWSPERMQINLEMTPTVKKLRAGDQAKYSYDVHYFDKAPVGR